MAHIRDFTHLYTLIDELSLGTTLVPLSGSTVAMLTQTEKSLSDLTLEEILSMAAKIGSAEADEGSLESELLKEVRASLDHYCIHYV